MNVEMLLVDKRSGRYSREVSSPNRPDPVMKHRAGMCLHYKLSVVGDKVVREQCTHNSVEDRANGLLCTNHEALLFPKKVASTVPQLAFVEAAEVIATDTKNRKESDLPLHNPRAMRRFTNKRNQGC